MRIETETPSFSKGERDGHPSRPEGTQSIVDEVDPSQNDAVLWRSSNGPWTVLGLQGIPRESISNVRDQTKARRHGRTCGRVVRVPRGRGVRRNCRATSHGGTGPGSARGTWKRRGASRRTDEGTKGPERMGKRTTTRAKKRIRTFAREE